VLRPPGSKLFGYEISIRQPRFHRLIRVSMRVESKLLFHRKEHHECCRIQTNVRTGVLRREHLKGSLIAGRHWPAAQFL